MSNKQQHEKAKQDHQKDQAEKGKVGAGGVAGAAAGGQLAGIEGEQTNNQRGLDPAPTGAAAADVGNTQQQGSITTGAEAQITSGTANNADTGTRDTPTGEQKDTSKATGTKDDPYSPGPRHVDKNDKNAPTPIDVANHGGSGDQTRSDYSMGDKPKQADGETDEQFAARMKTYEGARTEGEKTLPRHPHETDAQHKARIEHNKETERKGKMSARERMKEAGTHPDDLPEDASDEAKARAKKMLAYENIKDGIVSLNKYIETEMGGGVGVGRAQALFDEAIAALREHIG